MKILLVDPARYRPDGSVNRTSRGFLPAITLARLAALVPPGDEVRVCVDFLEEPDFAWKPDIVGITGYTKSMARAYDLAAEFRSRGAWVAMGGVHVTMMPDEAAARCDTVFVGEAEETWPRFLEDFRRGRPAGRYDGTPRPSMKGWPVPRFDLLGPERFYTLRTKGLLAKMVPAPAYSVETSRGCPHSCSFCSVSPFLGTQYRVRPVEDVVGELKALGARGAFFVDNNIFGDHARAKELMQALIPLRISWTSHATLAAADDKELMELAEASGCRAMTVGMEALDEENLSGYNKSFNKVDAYRRQLKAYADHGISVFASLVFMPGCGSREQFRRAYEFLTEARVPYTAWWNLTPLPATPFYEAVKADGRLKRENWWLQRPGRYPDYKFAGKDIPEAEFHALFMKYYRKFYSPASILRRIPTHFKKGWWAELVWNLGAMIVGHLRKDALSLYSPLGFDKGGLAFLRWRFFGAGKNV